MYIYILLNNYINAEWTLCSGKSHATSKSPLFIIPSLSNIISNRPVVQPPVIINHLYSKPGWWFQPLWETWKSAGMMTFPIYGKIKLMFQTTNQKLLLMIFWNIRFYCLCSSSYIIFHSTNCVYSIYIYIYIHLPDRIWYRTHPSSGFRTTVQHSSTNIRIASYTMKCLHEICSFSRKKICSLIHIIHVQSSSTKLVSRYQVWW